MILLGYGPVGDFIALKRAQSPRNPAPVLVPEVELERFRPYAVMLSKVYGHVHSKTDPDEVEQAAIIACWEAFQTWPGAGKSEDQLEPYVKGRMKWAAMDAVAVWSHTAAARRMREELPHFQFDENIDMDPEHRRTSARKRPPVFPHRELDGSIAA